MFGTLLKNIYILTAISASWSASHSYFPCICSKMPFTALWVENKSNNVMQTLEFITTIKEEETLILWKASHYTSSPKPYNRYLKNFVIRGCLREKAFRSYPNPEEDKVIMWDDWNNDARLTLGLKYFQTHFPCLAGNLFCKTQNCPNITA